MSHVNLESIARDFEAGAGARELRDTYHIGNAALLRKLVEARRRNLVSREALARLLVDRTRHDFPEDSESRLEAVLSCVNTELKQSALLMMDVYPATGYEIWKRLSEASDTSIPQASSIIEYIDRTFSPIGFIIDELFNFGNYKGKYFALSASGIEHGQPIAAFSLRYAVDNNLSLYQLFGSTASSGDSRSPTTEQEL